MTREFKPDDSFRGSIDTMDEIEDCKTYVAEYFSWNMPGHGQAVFTSWMKRKHFCSGYMPKPLRIFFQPIDDHDGSG